MYGFLADFHDAHGDAIPHRLKNPYKNPNVIWAKEYKVGATRVGFQKNQTKIDNRPRVQRLRALSKNGETNLNFKW